MGSSSNVDYSVGAPSSLGKQEDISSDPKVSIQNIADETREVPGGSRQTFEVGSSSGPPQAENNLSNNLSVHLNDSSSHTSLMSSWNINQMNVQEHPVLGTGAGLHSSYNSHPRPIASILPVMPHENFNQGLAINTFQISTLYNPLLAYGNPLFPLVLYPSQSPLPMWQWLNDISVSSRPYTSPDMPRMVLAPSFSGNLSQSAFTIDSSLRAGNIIESGLLPDLQGHSHHLHHHSLAVGSYDTLGGDYIHQMEHNLYYHQWPSLPWAPLTTNPAGRQQTALDFLPGFVSPGIGPGSGVGNFVFTPSPNPATYGHHGHDIVGQNSYFSGPSVTQSGHHLSLGVHHASQSTEAEVERHHRPMSEPHLQNIVGAQIEHQMYLVQSQAALMLPVHYVHHIAIGYPVGMFLQDMHHVMRLDVENMSYEELLALEDHIGNVSSGLSDETIMELLKWRYYECAVKEPISDDEICCVCREEYAQGEEIGELNCGHEFHTRCIKQWLIIKNTCPLCQMKGLDA
ncbi:uncharacterized protein LOC110682167 [Chenopodium quinoa]|uniref:uncharacterized protein LOC110682167 n=1 Tax=Chenopodium quinoa TaxID=63459 RepID=UPI000B77AB75|nr:uncharacterized protein LOC110682167 [Chenopodium quinoa]